MNHTTFAHASAFNATIDHKHKRMPDPKWKQKPSQKPEPLVSSLCFVGPKFRVSKMLKRKDYYTFDIIVV